MTKLETKLLAQLKGLLSDIQGLMGESSGVYGLHLNGDVSPWSELEEGGRFERLTHLSSAQEVISEAEAEAEAESEAAQQQIPKPSGDGWIAWGGGECPVEGAVSVRYRCGVEQRDMPGSCLNWRIEAHGGDIIAYRVIGEQK